MSRLMEFAVCCTNQCAWKCCQTKKGDINVRKFSQNIHRLINFDNLSPLICESSVYLNENEQTILKIGYNPLHFFEIITRMESKTKHSTILTSTELNELLEFLSNNFDENNTWRLLYTNIRPGMKFVIDLKATEPRSFSLHIGRKYLAVDEETLYALLRKKSYIKNYILLLEQRRKSYESMLFNLFNHFCYDGKSLKFATDLACSKYYVNNFFDEIINFHCDCINKNFAIDIGANFSEWFSKCVPIFIKTTMLNETDRLESFSSSDWPHNKKYINVKKLAKSGLYFTGEKDVVSCAFCCIELYDWKLDDNPVLDHHKYSPKCSFLTEPKRSLNIPIGDDKKIEELLSILPKIGDSDEVDFRK